MEIWGWKKEKDKATEKAKWVSKPLYQVKAVTKWIHARKWFQGGVPSEWRELLDLVVDLPTKVIGPNSGYWADRQRLVHKTILTQRRAAIFLKGALRKIHKHQEQESAGGSAG